MIRLQTRRAGPLVIAVTVDDHRNATATLGLTHNAAERRLLRLLDRKAHR